jgi:hypothetical protein
VDSDALLLLHAAALHPVDHVIPRCPGVAATRSPISGDVPGVESE